MSVTAFQIMDGEGVNGLAGVTPQKQVKTFATNVSAMYDATLRGDAYSWTGIDEDIDANDTALLVANRSLTRILVIHSVYVYSDIATAIKIHVPAPVTWAGGNAVVGVNLNRKLASNLAAATAFEDETANAFVAGNVILTVQTPELTTNQEGILIEPLHGGALYLGYDDAVAVDIIAEGGAFQCTITGYYIDP